MKLVKIHDINATTRLITSLLLLVMLTTLPAFSRAEDNQRADQSACGTQPADNAAADPASLVSALYDIVSGSAHRARDWARLAGLHAPGAIITPTQHQSRLEFAAAPQSLAKFIALNERLFANRGFYEREIFHRIQGFGHIAHVWSGYETREHPDGPVEARGINSFQLLNDGKRWCVLSATWDTETDAHPIVGGDSLEGFN